LPGVHAGLDQLEGDLAADRLGLLGDVDGAHAAFAEAFEELVAPGDDRAGGDARLGGVEGPGGGGVVGAVEDAVDALVEGEQLPQALAQGVVAGAGLVEEGVALGGVGHVQGGGEQGFLGHGAALVGDTRCFTLPCAVGGRNTSAVSDASQKRRAA
jgi:hypothetical protein